ncbi:MAG: glutamate-5-semialdehyde dehydrogenase [Candidatus Omnitrophica bacterium]|nr:glutamate-5-semialdehyde dehydrogenase [Candidatus Omnitrophota bacterium]
MEIKNIKGLNSLLKKIKDNTLKLGELSSEYKNRLLSGLADALSKNKSFIIRENQRDILIAKRLGLSSAFIDRLTLTERRIEQMKGSLLNLINLADPIGEVIKEWSVPSGLIIKKVRVPLGVILIIYESRPDVTSDCIGLCIKSSNAVILKGGSESLNSNLAIFRVFLETLKKLSFPSYAINFVSTKERKVLDKLLRYNEYIDLVIPRGGESLIRKITQLSRIPVIKHYKGICHIYVDEYADIEMARKVCANAKVQRPATCNAMESMLVHQSIAKEFLVPMLKEFLEAKVKIRGCAQTLKIAKDYGLFNKEFFKKATDKDYRTEYLDLILSVKVVKDMQEAIEHINEYGSHHSDAIITKDNEHAEEFLKRVDSACVYHNASTRFTDGYQFGMGAEIGISTDRLHARGPMALEELTTYKYVVKGSGQIRT